MMVKKERKDGDSFVPKEVFICKKCDRKFSSEIKLCNHVSMLHLDIFYTCNTCQIRLDEINDIKEHLEEEHESKAEHSSTCCSVCQKTFVGDLTFQHVNAAHSDIIDKLTVTSKDELKSLVKTPMASTEAKKPKKCLAYTKQVM